MILLMFALAFGAAASANMPVVSVSPPQVISASPKSELAIEKAEKQLVKQEKDYKQVIGSLYEINRRVKRVVYERSKLDQERIMTETQIRHLADKILTLEKEEKNTRGLLFAKIRFLHQFNAKAWSEYLFKATNSAQIERNMKILGVISKRDLEMMEQYQVTKIDLGRQRKNFVNRLEDLKKLESEIVLKERDLKQQNKARSEFLADLRMNQSATLKKLRSLQAKKADGMINETGILDGLATESFPDHKGQLSHPVQTPVTRGYGIFKEPSDKLVFSHRGWFYKTHTSLPVQSVYPGKISYQGYIPEFGKVVIIDHGDHYYTIYAGLSTMSMKVGDELREGDLVGQSGSFPYDGSDGVYFEIRHFSETMDPKSWMKGRTYDLTNYQWE